MTSYNVLVVGEESNGWLSDVLFEAGFDPRFQNSTMAALRRIRSQVFAAVTIDCTTARPDPVEFVLNVREFNTTIPVAVVAGAGCGAEIAAVDKVKGAEVLVPEAVEAWVADLFEDRLSRE